MTKDVPELRIIADELWAGGEERRKRPRRHTVRQRQSCDARGARMYLFSGLTKCGVCGAGFIMTAQAPLSMLRRTRPGPLRQPSDHPPRRGGSARVLKALQEKLLNQELFDEFCEEFTREMNRLRMNGAPACRQRKREVERIGTSIKKLLNLMLDDGIAVDEGKVEMKALDGRRKELEAQLNRRTSRRRSCTRRWPASTARRSQSSPWPFSSPQSRLEATEALRGLVDAIVLTPDGSKEELGIERTGTSRR